MIAVPRIAMTGTSTAVVCAAVQVMLRLPSGSSYLVEDVEDSSSLAGLPLIRTRAEESVDTVLAWQPGEGNRIIAVAPPQPLERAAVGIPERGCSVDTVGDVVQEALKQVRRRGAFCDHL